ncbi:hypothetical protein QN387_26195, partial [Pseudomonas sp. CCI3.1]
YKSTNKKRRISLDSRLSQNQQKKLISHFKSNHKLTFLCSQAAITPRHDQHLFGSVLAGLCKLFCNAPNRQATIPQ